MPREINWTRVNRNLCCPQCGEKAMVEGGTDGTEGYHTHRFKITREMALQLSEPSDEERKELRQQAVEMIREAGVNPEFAVVLRKLAEPWPMT